MIYIASPFFNSEELSFVKDIERALSRVGYEYFSPRADGILKDMTAKQKQESKAAIYASNVKNLKACSTMVAVIDGRDTGTTWEMGYAAALHRRVISISNKGYGVNVMLAESVIAHVRCIDEMLSALEGKLPAEDSTPADVY